jgi:hypothetical protein
MLGDGRDRDRGAANVIDGAVEELECSPNAAMC